MRCWQKALLKNGLAFTAIFRPLVTKTSVTGIDRPPLFPNRAAPASRAVRKLLRFYSFWACNRGWKLTKLIHLNCSNLCLIRARVAPELRPPYSYKACLLISTAYVTARQKMLQGLRIDKVK